LATSISRRAEGAPSLAIARPTLRTFALGAVALALLVGAAFLVSRSSIMHVRRIEVSGLARLSAPQVIRESGVSLRSNALWLDAGAAESALERDPWVAEATVERAPPWGVRIHVVERVPVAQVVLGTGYELIADDGTMLGVETRNPRLPSIVGTLAAKGESQAPDPEGAVLVLRYLDADLRSMVKDIGVNAGGAVEIHLQGGIEVNLGEPFDIRRKVDALTSTLRWARGQLARVKSVDVSAPETPAIRLGAP
jgi:cell division protein FtsQ